MIFCEEATLITIISEKNKNGFASTPIEKRQSVYCREKSATRTEFYDALRSGITVSLVLEVRIEDFELTARIKKDKKKAYAEKVEYDGAVYDIVRTYRNDRSTIELICS